MRPILRDSGEQPLPNNPTSYGTDPEVLYNTLKAKVSYQWQRGLESYWVFDRRTGERYSASSFSQAQAILKTILGQGTVERVTESPVEESAAH